MTNKVDAEKLRNVLRTLGENVTAKVLASRDSGQLVIRRQQNTVRRNFGLWYEVDPTMMNNFEPQAIEENEWDRKDFDSFLAQHVLTDPAYVQVEQIVIDSGHAASLARSFVGRVAYDAAIEASPNLDRQVATMLRDVTGAPLEHKIKVWLTGITLSESAVSISDFLSFRRPTQQDLEEKVRSETLPYAHAADLMMGQIRFSCIADYKVRESRVDIVQGHVDRLTTILCLFRLGSVSVPRYDVSTDSFSIFARFRTGLSKQVVSRFKYALSPDDGPTLLQALQVLTPLVPSVYDHPPIKPSFLSTALGWYNESLMAGGSVEGAIAWAVACLEALFLGDNPNTEISYRLSQRVIALLRCFGWAPLEIRKTLKQAYDVRSRHVHGAVPNKLSPEELNRLHRDLADYARVSCLAWTQLLATNKRKELLETLEDALIDDASNMRLQRWCNAVHFVRKPW